MPRDTEAYMSLPFNPALKDRARALRKAGVLAEVVFWQSVKGGKLNGWDFDRQKIIGNYIVDFYCANVGLVVEIYPIGSLSEEETDKDRAAYLKSLDLIVLHISDEAVLKHMDSVIEEILRIGTKGTTPARNSL